MNQKRLIPILIAFNLLLMLSVILDLGGPDVLARSPQVQTAPQTISYQGLLKDSSGHVYEGSKNLAFRIYTAETGGTELWEEIHLNVPVSAGAFAVLLGQTTTFPTGLFSVPDRWLEISVDGAPLSPRQKFTSAPYALNADTLDGYDSADLLNSGSDELAPGAVVYYPYESIQPGFTPLTTTAGIDIGPWHEITPGPNIFYGEHLLWTGTEVVCLGNSITNSNPILGAAYDPLSNNWRFISSVNAPSQRSYASAIWTGTEIILWGGRDKVTWNDTNTGARYNPATNTWQPTSTTNAPAAREYHNAVWAGNQMMVWGGAFEDGGLYNPTIDAWTPVTSTGAPKNNSYNVPAMVWTGSKVIVWSGEKPTPGALYDPATNTWSPMNTNNAPRYFDPYQPVGWTGSEMAIMSHQQEFFYNPTTNQWRHTYIQEYGGNNPSQITAIYNGKFLMINTGLYDMQTGRWAARTKIFYGKLFWVNDKLYGIDGSTLTGGYHTIQIIAPYRKD